MSTNRERQAAFRDKRRREGKRQITVWADGEALARFGAPGTWPARMDQLAGDIRRLEETLAAARTAAARLRSEAPPKRNPSIQASSKRTPTLVAHYTTTPGSWIEGKQRDRQEIDTEHDASRSITRITEVTTQTKHVRTALSGLLDEYIAARAIDDSEKQLLESALTLLNSISSAYDDAKDISKRKLTAVIKDFQARDALSRAISKQIIGESSVETTLSLAAVVKAGSYEIRRLKTDLMGGSSRFDTVARLYSDFRDDLSYRLRGYISSRLKDGEKPEAIRQALKAASEEVRGAVLGEHGKLIDEIKTALVAKRLELANRGEP